MEEEKRQTRILVAIALAFCALLIGYNAFYVPDASLESFVETDVSADGVDESQAESPGKINLNTASLEELDTLPGKMCIRDRKSSYQKTVTTLFL